MIKQLPAPELRLALSEGALSANILLKKLNQFNGVEICESELRNIVLDGPPPHLKDKTRLQYHIAFTLGLKSFYPEGFIPKFKCFNKPKSKPKPAKFTGSPKSPSYGPTQYVGISYLPKIRKYAATVYNEGKRHYCGTFPTLYEAVMAWNITAERMGREPQVWKG